MRYSLPKDAWKGEPAFIIGGGASLKDFDFGRLKGRGRVIAVNNAWERAPFADYLYFADRRWFEWNEHKLAGFKGPIVTRMAMRSNTALHRIGKTNREPLSHEPDCLAGFCGGSNALNMAYLLGADPIYLLGFDMSPGNWHDLHQLPPVPNQHRDKFIPYLNWMAEALQETGRLVFNTNLYSRLRCFPIIDLEELLAMDDISRAEMEKYNFIWQQPSYRKTSPGMRETSRAYASLGIAEGDTLYDFGCGGGQAVDWFLDRNVHAVGIDIADKAPATQIPFVQASLWELPESLGVADWGFCCDVMEHIPQDKVDAVLRAIRSKVTRGAWIRIATRKDAMGPRLIGSPLHLSVFSSEWWRRKVENVFPFVHMVHRDHKDVVFRCMIDAKEAAR